MSNVIVVMAVYEEERMLPGALESLRGKNLGGVHVFDGAWRDFGDGHYQSQDATRGIVEAYGGVWHPAEGFWSSQEEKRTAMFHEVGASQWDYIFVFDADERLEGDFTHHLDQAAYSVMNRCVGGNDMPGIRTEWPNGDYSEQYIPAIRVFRYHASLKCLWPGAYERNGRLIEVYRPDKRAYGGYASRIPVVRGVAFTHHGADRDDEKMRQKLAYYTVEHPRRERRAEDYDG